jgi:hypothetical protein
MCGEHLCVCISAYECCVYEYLDPSSAHDSAASCTMIICQSLCVNLSVCESKSESES